MTITAVAHKWGFTDTTLFSRRFREAYGMSPREWRQAHTADNRPSIAAVGTVLAVPAPQCAVSKESDADSLFHRPLRCLVCRNQHRLSA